MEVGIPAAEGGHFARGEVKSESMFGEFGKDGGRCHSQPLIAVLGEETVRGGDLCGRRQHLDARQ
jgi:hypothetical protein